MSHKIHRQGGAAIVTAIFLIIILSLMATGMVSLLATNQQSINNEITSAKSYIAGRTCLQWSMYQIVFSSTTGTYSNNFNDESSNLFNSRCSVDISTIPDHDVNDGRSLIFYNIKVTTEFADSTSPEYSKRTLRLQYLP